MVDIKVTAITTEFRKKRQHLEQCYEMHPRLYIPLYTEK